MLLLVSSFRVNVIASTEKNRPYFKGYIPEIITYEPLDICSFDEYKLKRMIKLVSKYNSYNEIIQFYATIGIGSCM